MNLMYRYIRKTLYNNKIRTIVTICGIILSVALFTGVTTSVSSVRQFLLDIMRQRLEPGQELVLDSTTQKMLNGMQAILLAIVMTGSISLIYNSFAISVGERRLQYGILSSMGATKKQIRKSVFYEAALLGVIGIPVGVAAGIGGVALTFYLLGDQFARFLQNGAGLEIHMQASVMSVILAVIISLITLYVSAWIPARRAIRVSAIEAIRQNNDIKINPRSVKTSSVTSRMFRVEGELASKNFKRNKKSYRATIFSLSISVLLFIATSSFCEFFQRSLNDVYSDTEADIYIEDNKWQVYGDAGLEDILTDDRIKEYYDHISSMKGVTDSVQTWFYEAVYDPDNSGWEGSEDVMLVFVEDDRYSRWLKQRGYDVDEYMNGSNPKALIMDERVEYDPEGNKYVTTTYFDRGNFSMELYMPEKLSADYEEFHKGNEDDYRKVTIQAGELERSDDRLLGLGQNKRYIKVLLPYHCKNEIVGNIPVGRNLALTSEEPDMLEQDILSYIEENMSDIDNQLADGIWQQIISVVNVFAERTTAKALMTVMRVFGYGFIIVLSLIAIANVFNTISTGIMLRRREFAVLRSIGMTKKGFHRMMTFECLIYGFKGLLYGLILGFGAHMLVWETLKIKLEGVFFIPWGSVGISIITVFAVVFITVFYSMRKMPVEHLAEEIRY